MLQSIDSGSDESGVRRRAWIGSVARSTPASLESALANHLAKPQAWLRRPETGLYMIRGRVGGTGAKFNVGEMTVTRCAVRVRTSPDAEHVGVAYIMGCSHRHAELAAIADALLQDETLHETLHHELIAPIQQTQADRDAAQLRKAQATRVEFFTVAREAKKA